MRFPSTSRGLLYPPQVPGLRPLTPHRTGKSSSCPVRRLRRGTSNWDPRYVFHLDLTDGDHRYRLLTHLRQLAQRNDLTLEFSHDLIGAIDDWLALPFLHADSSSITPWQPSWSMDAASSSQRYSWFTSAPTILECYLRLTSTPKMYAKKW